MYNPVSTYRIQFQKEFSFTDFEKIISYLQKLGIQTIYASPIFESTPGSVHGYDVLNPRKINPEIGTIEQMKSISKQLKEKEIGWLQDIVPNHMAYHTGNKWLVDVLEKGKHSIYAPFFDIIWDSSVYDGRIMVPFLGSTLEDAIEKDELKLTLREEGVHLSYYDNHYPIHPNSYSAILHQRKRLSADIKQIIKSISELETIEDAKIYSEKWNETKLHLFKNEACKNSLQSSIGAINENKETLAEIVNAQVYQLCHWQETDYQINFRRFFTINGLICLNIQDENVFNHYHKLIRSFLEAGIYNGLRVDHIDGLFDPSQYLDRLRCLAGDETYIVVEKILEPKETLLHQWNIEGNTGYDFLALVNNVFTNKKNETAFTKFYRQLTKDHKSIHQHLHDKKAGILFNYMEGELENLYRLFLQLKLIDRKLQSSVHPDDLKNAIAEFLIQCPVYRYYGTSFPLDEPEASEIQNVLNRMRRSGAADEIAISILEKAFLHKPHQNDEDYNKRIAKFYQRCMQFSGPLMAKGVEDTLMYTYNRFIGHNEVGDSPDSFGISADDFHEAMIERQENWPLSLNATSTHDTKRGEDVRARLNVLSDMPGDWFNIVQQWQQLTQGYKQNNFPDKNDEYLIYQSLVGNYPMPRQGDDNFEQRFIAYLQKAFREAKQHSNWTSPNEGYENAAKDFVKKLLNKNGAFWKSFEEFHSGIVDFGIINSLSQLLLKFTCPGVPDTYQGCEVWDFSFVDPDNRRPVDYEKRIQWLNEFPQQEDETFLQQLWTNRYDGRIKLWLTSKLLQWRRGQKEFLQQAEYIPLTVEGTYKNHVLAFARKYKQHLFIVTVPLHLAELCKMQNANISEVDWKDTAIVLPGKLSGEIENILTKEIFEDKFAIKDLFAQFPIAFFKTQLEEHKRAAGILLHVTSLPSPFGIGDMGHEAKVFAGFLYRSKQHYWQLLPINPTEAGQGNSPYSVISSMAGNPLLISPELIAKEKLLGSNDLKQYYLPQESKAEYTKAGEVKNSLFDKAYQNFKTGNFTNLQNDFEQFCEKEKYWLDDFALYAVLKKRNGGKAWYEWENNFKQRSIEMLREFSTDHSDEISKTKWLQFIFFRQWKDLKAYCNNMNIQLIGDMPFYVSYDSSDVWANKEIFALDENGNRTGVAGVPPDAFSDDGQLWGMPVFKWDVLKERNYDWWIERLKKNIELFDIVRLDHFRAFDEYWEVPAGETTAKNGQWKFGPGIDFFETAQKELGELPFIAEDLGEITQSVYQLRDAFRLPGMKVLQFAFGSDMPHSPHILHHHEQNFVVYTGTHDNNTTLGWYKTETSDEMKKRIGQYLGKAFNENEIHRELSRLAYSSVGKIAILPMQDILGLDENSRMNKPSSGDNNWHWRLTPAQLSVDAENQLKEWSFIYDRQ
ncbi:MAG TPA: malto-oligosyltrehalose synthase [Flavisolibacter sp.]|jgi:malto-oligosyltrehalose synthase/4-alpha-glucanotransferase|nr:malto-oligosyltrehalose synthase [Flavisolibacter sp.]